MPKAKAPRTQPGAAAKAGPGRPRIPVGFVCPRPGHDDFPVFSSGRRTKSDGTPTRRLRCVAPDGTEHGFEIDASAEATVVIKPERCPQHPDGRTHRAGTYSSGGHPRQMFRCCPADGSRPHRFTPPVPRDQVCGDETCEECAQERQPLHGDQAAGRVHRFSARQVAKVLIALSEGHTYAAAGLAARKSRATDARAARSKAKRNANSKAMDPAAVLDHSDEPADTWQVAASFAETYTPVLWEPWHEQQRAAARTVDRHTDTLRVVVLDWKPYFGTAVRNAGGSKAQLFVVFALSEVEVPLGGSAPTSRTRLLRALPDASAEAVLLLIHELGYLPDVVISDGASSIGRAINELRRATRVDIGWVLSKHHLRNRIRDLLALLESHRQFPFQTPTHLAEQVDGPGRSLLAGVDDWNDWWARLDAALDAQNIPRALRPDGWRRTHNATVIESLQWWEANPRLPGSTGAVESVLSRQVAPLLAGRYARMSNLARTNYLLNLATLRLNEQMGSVSAVSSRIVADLRANDGFAVPTKQLNDPGTYRSLLDKELPARLLADRLAAEPWPTR